MCRWWLSFPFLGGCLVLFLYLDIRALFVVWCCSVFWWLWIVVLWVKIRVIIIIIILRWWRDWIIAERALREFMG